MSNLITNAPPSVVQFLRPPFRSKICIEFRVDFRGKSGYQGKGGVLWIGKRDGGITDGYRDTHE